MAELSAVFKGEDDISSIFDKMANSGARAVDQWESASETASRAFEEATTGAGSAAKAMETAASSTDIWTSALGNYDKSLMESIYSTEELVDLGYKTEDALTSVAKSAGESTDSIGELSKAVDENEKEFKELGEEAEKAEEATTSMVDNLGKALAAAGIAKLLNDISAAVMDMANEFSEAESIIVKATGATEAQLDSLSASMLNVYANVDDGDIKNTAAAIGEINTRLGLQGQELETVASLFMDYADNTNSNVVGAVQSVTKVMKNWGVEIDDTENLLDKLTLAGQMSGASVGSLSDMVVTNKATLQQLGYNLNDSIALLSMFEYEGLNASSIMMGFRSAVTGFSADGKEASTAMQEVIDQIASMADESEATSLSIQTFGSRAGAELAYAIRNGKFEIDEWTAAIEKSNGTLERTDEAADTVADKWQIASNNMHAAFSGVLSPAINSISTAFANLVGGIGDFLQQNEWAVPLITGIGVALGVVAAAFAAYTIATTIATAVTTAFGVASMAALWPLYLIAAAIGAVVAIGVSLFNSSKKNTDEIRELSSASREQYYELQDLERQYSEVCSVMGETSTEAQLMKRELDDATSAFENNKKTSEEVAQAQREVIDAYNEMVAAYTESSQKLSIEQQSTDNLIATLGDLMASEERSAATKQQILGVVDLLNQAVPNLGLAYDELTDSLNMGTDALNINADAILAAAEAEYAAQQNALDYDTLLKQIALRAELAEKEQIALENLKAQQREVAYWQDEMTNAMSRYQEEWGYTDEEMESQAYAFQTERYMIEQANLALEENTRMHDEAANAVAANEAQIQSLSEGLADYAQEQEAAAEAADELTKAQTEAAQAFEEYTDEVTGRMDELTQAYTAAYDAAYKSVSGQYQLWDEAAKVVVTSAEKINGAIESQISYWQNYNSNLAGLSDRTDDIAGLSDMLASFADGSKDSVNAVAGMADASDEDLRKMVENWNTLQDEQAAVATSIAELETDFTDSMLAMYEEVNSTVQEMNLSDEARESARETMRGYVNGIDSMLSEVQVAYNRLATAGLHALSGSGLPEYMSAVPGFATGTTNAPDMYLAGENGPELIVGAGGSTVFPADTTNDILAAAGRVSTNFEPPEGFEASGPGQNGAGSPNEKRIILDINGSGDIDITNINEEAVWDIVAPKLKAAFMGIVQEEIFEEGDGSYGF